MACDAQKGTLFLIPASLGEADLNSVWPAGHKEIINTIDVFIVENIRTARRFLKKAGYKLSFDDAIFHLLNKHTSESESALFLNAAKEGKWVGLLSEAGCPGVADPGQLIVSEAHARGIPVKPLVGANSILLALMASGMNGQSFCFQGYLPIDKKMRNQKIRELESNSQRTGATQIFMETPFRNNQLTEDLLKNCHPATRLCIAAELTAPEEYIASKSIGEWRKTKIPDLHKRPAIFLLLA